MNVKTGNIVICEYFHYYFPSLAVFNSEYFDKMGEGKFPFTKSEELGGFIYTGSEWNEIAVFVKHYLPDSQRPREPKYVEVLTLYTIHTVDFSDHIIEKKVLETLEIHFNIRNEFLGDLEDLLSESDLYFDRKNLQSSHVFYCILKTEDSMFVSLDDLSETVVAINNKQDKIILWIEEGNLFILEMESMRDSHWIEKFEKDNFFYLSYLQYVNFFYEDSPVSVKNKFLEEVKEFDQYNDLFSEINEFDPVSKHTLIPLYAIRNRMSSQVLRLNGLFQDLDPTHKNFTKEGTELIERFIASIKNSKQYQEDITDLRDLLEGHLNSICREMEKDQKAFHDELERHMNNRRAIYGDVDSHLSQLFSFETIAIILLLAFCIILWGRPLNTAELLLKIRNKFYLFVPFFAYIVIYDITVLILIQMQIYNGKIFILSLPILFITWLVFLFAKYRKRNTNKKINSPNVTRVTKSKKNLNFTDHPLE